MSVRVLFLCSANSARSLMAEAILRQLGGDSVQAYSAGTNPTAPEPGALAALQSIGIATEDLHSKTITELGQHNFDYVISLCDRARQECRVDVQEHNFVAWDFPDPVALGLDIQDGPLHILQYLVPDSGLFDHRVHFLQGIGQFAFRLVLDLKKFRNRVFHSS